MVKGDKVSLRPVQRSDLTLLSTWTNDLSHNSEYNSFGFRHNYIEEAFAKDGLVDGRGGTLLIVKCEAEEVIGSVSYHQVAYGPNEGSQAYNIGITLQPAARGKGFGTEAQHLLAAYLFATYPVMRVEASTDITNTAEQRALEKAGFTREGGAKSPVALG